ncbi:hypothetical protein TNCT_683091 [Trichonephila clavata]|uniref:Uncharacterized protein n=1 Tax=Trichonephila clavata TaxID=2740835 RepID=A0A8X6L9G2_TRICU|nr:hypothetical protein TNCT_683091 [Trichonephila clavata]
MDIKMNEQYEELDVKCKEASYLKEMSKKESANNNTIGQCNTGILTYEGLPQMLPPARDSSKTEQSKMNQECIHLKNERNWTEKTLDSSNKLMGNCPHFELKDDLQSDYNFKNLSITKTQGQAIKEIEHSKNDLLWANEKNKNYVENSKLNMNNILIDDTSENRNFNKDEHLLSKVKKTEYEKQKYESENVRKIKTNEEHKKGKKHNWFNLFKKKKSKTTEAAQPKKKKEKDCKIM